MKNKIMISLLAMLALIVAMLPAVSACSNPGSGEQVLRIGISTPSTGPAAEKGAPMGHGNLDAVKYINEELGGINGIKLEAVWLDNGYDASKIVTNVNKFMDDGCLMFGTSSSKMMSSVMEVANRAGFPGIVVFNAPILHRPPQHVYGQMPDYGDDWAAFANYYLENIWEGEGKPKMALHLLNNTTGYGARDAAKALADGMGIEIVAIEEHSATDISMMDSMTRIKSKEPDVLYISSTPAPTALVIKAASEIGLYPGLTIGCGHASFTKALVDIAGADVVEGVYGMFPTANWGDPVPGMEKVVEYAQQYHPDDVGNLDYVTAWAQTMIMAEALRLAVENAGYEAIAKGDAEAWRIVEEQGIKKLNNYEVGGLHGPVSYEPGDNRLSKAVRVFQAQGGQIKPVSDWIDAPLIKYEEYDWFGK